MDNNHKKLLDIEYDECNIHGICSISPAFSAIKSAVFAYLQELAFYITKIWTFGARNNALKCNFINIFSVLITNSEANETNINNLFLKILANFHFSAPNLLPKL